MPNHYYQTIFDAKRLLNPSAYYLNEEELVGDLSLQIDQDISECEEIIDDGNLGNVSEQDVHEAYCRGLVLISIKYNPNNTRYQFIEGILAKLEECATRWGISHDLTDERICEIYDKMISSEPIEHVLSKFTLNELTTYGW